ncbi:MAG: hypothetical protein J6S67_16660 [Methanobrevibacter sp.]|nr:hypothetical protein [Methanobrevibacter sp.]
MTKTYKVIKRRYVKDDRTLGSAYFIARGQWANGKLAYSMCDELGKTLDDDECSYVQYRDYDGLIMEHI